MDKLVGFLSLWFLLFGGVAYAQAPFDPSSLKPNPMIERMVRESPNEIVEMSGYIGPSTPDTVRLYQDLSLSRYFEIPRGAIVNAVPSSQGDTGPMMLYVRGDATVVSARKGPATVVYSSRLSGSFPTRGLSVRERPLHPDDTCVLQCASCLLTPLGCVGCALCAYTQ